MSIASSVSRPRLPTDTEFYANSVRGAWLPSNLAEDIKHDRKVALKVLKPELAALLGAERFVIEIKTTAGLQHPHILPLVRTDVRSH